MSASRRARTPRPQPAIGVQTVAVVVEAQDGTTRTYTLAIDVTSATLTDLTEASRWLGLATPPP